MDYMDPWNLILASLHCPKPESVGDRKRRNLYTVIIQNPRLMEEPPSHIMPVAFWKKIDPTGNEMLAREVIPIALVHNSVTRTNLMAPSNYRRSGIVQNKGEPEISWQVAPMTNTVTFAARHKIVKPLFLVMSMLGIISRLLIL
ncbi:uncharacterized protein LOC111536453 [Piliocolobus tephrosceles]|uniref:uncharacterized protein LOC111536453 n=1 Tax=Piliocolobus tephrosceles TaxID=591936 RepID=UPI000C298D2B|nr:uncharacterized protein LOC111536453 [Piliocolobus tephrosceles]